MTVITEWDVLKMHHAESSHNCSSMFIKQSCEEPIVAALAELNDTLHCISNSRVVSNSARPALLRFLATYLVEFQTAAPACHERASLAFTLPPLGRVAHTRRAASHLAPVLLDHLNRFDVKHQISHLLPQILHDRCLENQYNAQPAV